jgi:type I restriction enzyme, S subunit
MNTYPSYKDSGVECVGDIPKDWQVKRVKYLLNSYDGIKIGPFGSALKLDTLSDSGVKIYGQANIIKDDFTLGHRYLTVEQFNKNFTQYEIIDGDVLVTMMGTTGKSKVFKDSYERGILDSHLLRLRFNKLKLSSRLFSIVLQQSDYIFQQLKMSSKGSIMEGLNSSIVRELSFITPPPDEQNDVLNYLDSETLKIDTLIKLTEQKIELLREQRTALINQCVTKGLNPNVEMKDSGVEWIGEIPLDWCVRKLNHICTKIRNGYVGPTRGIMKDSGVKYIQGIHIKKGEVNFTPDGDYYVSDEWSQKHSESILQEGDVLVVQTGTIGNVGYVQRELANSNCHALIIVRINQSEGIGRFLHYLFLSNYVQSYLQTIKTGEILYHINTKKLRPLDVVVPSRPEQQQIIDYLDRQTFKIDSRIEKESQRIELLKEYRQALISEVVTGKIDVRDEVVA